jgi:hypothetical protein
MNNVGSQAVRPMSAARATDVGQVSAAERYLRMLTENAGPRTLLDVRYRTEEGGIARIFLPATSNVAASTIESIGSRTDVYVGCALRVRRRGTRDDIAPTALVWADCDTPEALAALEAFPFRPTMIVASGSTAHTHAYWTLTHPLGTDELESANRRLAMALGADTRCADAARILRPPGTLNHKHDPPRPVELIEQTAVRYRPEELLAALPPLARHEQTTDAPPRPWDTRGMDPLQQIKPAHYILLLTGRTVGRDGKIECPFHDDSPSLHVYDTPEQGWACYGCKTPDGRPRGGDIYTLASLLWNIPAHGRDFIDLRARLEDTFRITRARGADRTPRELADNAFPGLEL